MWCPHERHSGRQACRMWAGHVGCGQGMSDVECKGLLGWAVQGMWGNTGGLGRGCRATCRATTGWVRTKRCYTPRTRDGILAVYQCHYSSHALHTTMACSACELPSPFRPVGGRVGIRDLSAYWGGTARHAQFWYLGRVGRKARGLRALRL